MKAKHTKTNSIAYIILAVLILGMVLVYFEKATLTEVSTFGSGIIGLLTALGLLKAADAKKVPAEIEEEEGGDNGNI